LHCSTATLTAVPRRSARRPAMVPPHGCRQDTCVKSDKAYKAACQITKSRRRKHNNPLYSNTCDTTRGLAPKLLTFPQKPPAENKAHDNPTDLSRLRCDHPG